MTPGWIGVLAGCAIVAGLFLMGMSAVGSVRAMATWCFVAGLAVALAGAVAVVAAAALAVGV